MEAKHQANDELDRRIDVAVAGYVDTEPLGGLEERVLNRVRVAETGSRKLWRWAAACAMAASIVWAVVTLREQAPAPAKPVQVAREPKISPPRLAASTDKPEIRLHAVRMRRAQTHRPSIPPKLEKFPAHAPLSDEERALMAFVRQHPAEAREAFADLRKRTDSPVEIQPIEIPPLQSDGAR